VRFGVVILLAAGLLAAGCGEDTAQHAARVAVQQHVGGARTRCTQTARVYLQLQETKLYVCIVYRPDGLCDSWTATRRGGRRFRVDLRRREVDCLLPAG
jgi:hypothetical protein